MTVPATTPTSTSTSLSSDVSRFSEARLVPDTLAMAWRSLITMVRNFGESFDVLLQPIMFTVMFGELFGGAIAGDVKAYLPTIVPGLVIMNALTTSQSVGGDLREDMLKVFVRHNPVSHIVDGCRYLLDGTAGSAGDVRAAIIGSLLVLAITAPLTVFRYQRRNACTVRRGLSRPRPPEPRARCGPDPGSSPRPDPAPVRRAARCGCAGSRGRADGKSD